MITLFPAGGFKLWECALDLSAHLCHAFGIRATQERWSSALPGGTRVLELGCGHGLPGILLMLAGCEVHFQASMPFLLSLVAGGCIQRAVSSPLPEHVSTFWPQPLIASSPFRHLTWYIHPLQDYNAEVLRSLTALNAWRNLRSRPGLADLQNKQPRYFAGMMPSVSPMLSVLPPWPVQGLAEDLRLQMSHQQVWQVTGQSMLLQVTGLHYQIFCTVGVSWEAMTSSWPLRPSTAQTARSSYCAASRRYSSSPKRVPVRGLFGNDSHGGMGRQTTYPLQYCLLLP